MLSLKSFHSYSKLLLMALDYHCPALIVYLVCRFGLSNIDVVLLYLYRLVAGVKLWNHAVKCPWLLLLYFKGTFTVDNSQ